MQTCRKPTDFRRPSCPHGGRRFYEELRCFDPDGSDSPDIGYEDWERQAAHTTCPIGKIGQRDGLGPGARLLRNVSVSRERDKVRGQNGYAQKQSIGCIRKFSVLTISVETVLWREQHPRLPKQGSTRSPVPAYWASEEE